jgi:segregation and condensation protein B
VKRLLDELRDHYRGRGIQLDEVAGGYLFRSSATYGAFVRDLSKQKPVRLTRAQLETLAILAYRQPMTRPEIDDIRGVDSGPVLKVLLERDLVRMLGKKDEPGRPILYGTTAHFLEFFGLKSLKDLPTLREFTELTDDSRAVVERELGDDGEGGDAGEPAGGPAEEPGAEGRDAAAEPRGPDPDDEGAHSAIPDAPEGGGGEPADRDDDAGRVFDDVPTAAETNADPEDDPRA